MTDLETSQKSIVPCGKVDIRVGYKGSGEGVGRKGVWVGLRGIRHTTDRRLVGQQESVLGDQRFKGNPLLRFSL